MAKAEFLNRFVQRYLWDPEPKNDPLIGDSIWCLGEEYLNDSQKSATNLPSVESSTSTAGHELDADTVVVNRSQPHHSPFSRASADEASTANHEPHTSAEWPRAFLDDFEARFWFTYRAQFPIIKKSSNPDASRGISLPVRLRSQLVDPDGFTSDTGWGCMIRSGQCVVANAIAILRFGRGWRRGSRELDERCLISLFADDPRSPFSFHRFVGHGAAACGKYPGMWFGPSATARCIKALSEEEANPDLSVFVNGDGPDVYEDVVFRLAKQPNQSFRPVLILVGVRLGIDGVNPLYWTALKRTLRMRQCVGIAGGQPSASHYFVAVQGDSFFYLDPHQTQPALPWMENPERYSQTDVNSCHTRRLRRVHIKAMDPSMLLAFLIRDEGDWRDWRWAVSENKDGKSIVHVADTEQPVRGIASDTPERMQDTNSSLTQDGEEEDDGFINVQSPS